MLQPDGRRVTRQYIDGGRQGTEHAFRIKGDALAVIHMRCAQHGQIQLQYSVAVQRVVTEECQYPPVAKQGYDAEYQGATQAEVAHDERGKQVAQANTLQHAHDPGIGERRRREVRGKEREPVQQIAAQENQRAALDHALEEIRLVMGFELLHAQAHGGTHHEQKRWEHQVGQRKAVPGCVFQRGIAIFTAWRVHDNHQRQRQAAKDVQRQIAWGSRIRHLRVSI